MKKGIALLLIAMLCTLGIFDLTAKFSPQQGILVAGNCFLWYNTGKDKNGGETDGIA